MISVSLSFAPFISQENITVYEIITMVVAILSFVAQFTIGILLIVYAVPWGKKLIQQDSSEANVTSISFEQVQVLAFAVVGAWFFAGTLSSLFSDVYSASVVLKHLYKGEYPVRMQANDWRRLLIAFGAILKTALGLWMFFGARGFANFWRSLRNLGTPTPGAASTE
ncbi:MAG: hypothetical protein ACREFE_07020 [Limisphaerales bacterium]